MLILLQFQFTNICAIVLHLTNQLPLASCQVMLTIKNSYISECDTNTSMLFKDLLHTTSLTTFTIYIAVLVYCIRPIPICSLYALFNV